MNFEITPAELFETVGRLETEKKLMLRRIDELEAELEALSAPPVKRLPNLKLNKAASGNSEEKPKKGKKPTQKTPAA